MYSTSYMFTFPTEMVCEWQYKVFQWWSYCPWTTCYCSTWTVCGNYSTIIHLHHGLATGKSFAAATINIARQWTQDRPLPPLQRPWVLRYSFQPLVLPFKKQYNWWACVELSRRLLLVLFIISFPQNEVGMRL